MSKTYNLMDVVKQGSTPPPCDEALGIKASSAEDGVARGIWEVKDTFLNGNGVVMGGFVSAAADTAMAYALASSLKEGQMFASINLHTTFHRPVRPGQVEFEARVERLGRTVAYVVASLIQDGKEVAFSTSSVMVQ
ncbi:PaaI family thioesterase [Ammoniphilus sp. CFH 90114]|uniref:PaaI family thioesterase n=1 Tax=Ammoniphilus sp. CFH 90114 TaxID=2493665 RepID=UPI00100F7269|nr:PaaI family thioesterase [Ammoniphilus sp. CFH 90114]RXT01540.1 PaaI family thioesterase [Ammoniphilus sp. CFH 90114]